MYIPAGSGSANGGSNLGVSVLYSGNVLSIAIPDYGSALASDDPSDTIPDGTVAALCSRQSGNGGWPPPFHKSKSLRDVNNIAPAEKSPNQRRRKPAPIFLKNMCSICRRVEEIGKNISDHYNI